MSIQPAPHLGEDTQYAVIVLVPDVADAQRLAAALDDARRPDGPLAVIAVPPVRGLAFFADQARQAKLDRWWAHAIPDNALPLFVLQHEHGIEQWLPGLDGHFIVGADSARDVELYASLRHVTLAGSAGLLELAQATVASCVPGRLFREDADGRLQRRLAPVAVDAQARFRRARLVATDEVVHPWSSGDDHDPIPNLPSAVASREEARREDLVRALTITLRRLQQIRSAG